MKHSTTPTDLKQSVVFQSMTFDILGNVLRSADNPGALGIYLAEQMRELTGARIVILLQCLHSFGETGHRVVCVNPERRQNLAESVEVDRLAELTHHLEGTDVWNPKTGNGEAEEILTALGCGLSIVVPLKVGFIGVGALLLLDLPDAHNITLVVKTLDMLSTVVALVFRNSLLYEEQEAIIEERTRKLKESEERFRHLSELSFEAIGIHEQGVLIEANEQYFEMFGYDKDELLGKQAIPLTVAPESIDFLREQIKSGSSGPYEAIGLHKDGSKFPIEIRAREVEYRGRKERVGIIRDITKRKRAEVALRESEEKYRLLAENSPNGIFVSDAERLLYVNSRLSEITGFTESELLGMKDPVKSLFAPEEQERVLGYAQSRLSGKSTPTGYETRGIRKDGREVLFKLTVSSIVLAGKRVLQGTIEDITERKRAEEALRKSREQYQILFNSMLDGYAIHEIICDDDGIPLDYKFLDINPAFERFTGLGREIIGQTVRQVLPMIEECWIETYGRVALTGETVRFENYAQDLKKWFEVVAFSPAKGQFVTVFQDVTERKRAEEILKEYSERLEAMVEERTVELREAQEQLVRREKLAVLGQLAGGVAHELRNPLGVLSNAAYFLQLTLSNPDESAREYLDIISAEIRNATVIVSDLLDFARTRPALREERAISTLVDRVLVKHLPPQDVQVITEIPADLPAVYVDPNQIELVLANLVTNAYQSMPQGGYLTIRASLEAREQGSRGAGERQTMRQGDEETQGFSSALVHEVSPPRTPASLLRLSIIDTGSGISKENMNKVFEPLFTTKARGIGLGLAISKNLVETNNGSLEVESKVGQGSTFIVKLPLAETGSHQQSVISNQ